MTKTIFCQTPLISQHFNKMLLSTPSPEFKHNLIRKMIKEREQR